MTKAIVEFEKTWEFNKFSLKLDCCLAGVATISETEQKSLALFMKTDEGGGKCIHTAITGSLKPLKI